MAVRGHAGTRHITTNFYIVVKVSDCAKCVPVEIINCGTQLVFFLNGRHPLSILTVYLDCALYVLCVIQECSLFKMLL